VRIDKAVGLIVDVLKGLEYLHRKELLHNDIKPANILVGDRGEGRLSDYGISVVSPSLRPVVPGCAYTPHASPEYFQTGLVSSLTDIYQVGVTLFRLVNGIGCVKEDFYCLPESKFAMNVLQGKIPRVKDYKGFVPSQLRSVINKAVSNDPASRYQSPLEMRRALENVKLKGYWDCGTNNDLIGIGGKCEYSFVEVVRNGNVIGGDAIQRNNDTGRRIRLSKYSVHNVAHRDVMKAKKNFMQAVVSGAV